MKESYEKIAGKKIRNTSNIIDEKEMYALIQRVTGSKVYADKFVFKSLAYNSDGADRYEMYDDGDKIVIEATCGVAAAVAFNYYLREYCNSYFGPINENINLPDVPPELGKSIKNNSVFLFRYFMNYCTFGFTYLYAGWKEYEKLTDWMLLSGINVYLNIVGHEIVWRDMLMLLGYTKQQAVDYICGPAYTPWQWMGNVTHYGGNLPEWWFDEQKELGNKINNKMRAFGAEPMLPGFFGMVPQDFSTKHPSSKPIDQGLFLYAFHRPSIIGGNDALFDKAAAIFYDKTKEHFGDVHYFSGDPFHEGGTTDGIDLTEYARQIIATMKKHTKDGIWFLQGWDKNPKKEMLDAVEKEDVIVINLSSDKKYNSSKNYEGHPFIYSATCNFGGARLMDGNLKGLLLEPFDAVKRDDIMSVGVGMTMEAVELDEILYEGIAYNSIRGEKPDIEEFLRSYVKARFGRVYNNLVEAFRIIADHILTLNENSNYSGRESGLCAAPGLDVKKVSYSSVALKVSYDEKQLEKVLALMLESYDELKDNECYIFDITDIKRQINANRSWHIIDNLLSSFKNKDEIGFELYAKELLELYDVQNELMSKNPRTRLDAYIEKAKNMGRNPSEKTMFAYNALVLLTNWLDKSHPVLDLDYGHREWHGMLSEFYKKRWQIFIEMMRMHINNPENLPDVAWQEYCYTFIMGSISEN